MSSSGLKWADDGDDITFSLNPGAAEAFQIYLQGAHILLK
jgi:hypothetical protein